MGGSNHNFCLCILVASLSPFPDVVPSPSGSGTGPQTVSQGRPKRRWAWSPTCTHRHICVIYRSIDDKCSQPSPPAPLRVGRSVWFKFPRVGKERVLWSCRHSTGIFETNDRLPKTKSISVNIFHSVPVNFWWIPILYPFEVESHPKVFIG